MKRELRELDRQIVIRFEFLDTPGDEIAPGSNKIGKHFENERRGHNPSVFSCYPIGDNWILLFLVSRSQRAIAVL
jgi:hypothetical protein